jgi:hypothetical protein
MPSQRASQPAQVTGNQTPARPQTGSQSRRRPVSEYRDRLPTSAGTKAGNSIGALEAEYFGCLVFIFLTVFTDQSSTYASKMLAVMKRATLVSILFFILALMSAGSGNIARVAKALGLLVLAGIILSGPGQNTIAELDKFFGADWTSGNTGSTTPSGDSSANAPAGQQASPSIIGGIGSEISNAGKDVGSAISGAYHKIVSLL